MLATSVESLAIFQSTLPARGATTPQAPTPIITSNFNPRSPHGERQLLRGLACNIRYFNPRSPHGERPYRSNLRVSSIYFNPRSPHGERRGQNSFQHEANYFNPRSPHGERPQAPARTQAILPISIHAPRTGSDVMGESQLSFYYNFNPRSPHGERRISGLNGRMVEAISIHAPRTGSDQTRLNTIETALNFNPRSPHGERQGCCIASRRWNANFNPRSPHGERPRKVTILSIRIIGFAQKVYHKTVLLRISLAENAVILPEKPRNPVRTSLQKAGGLRFARAIRAARPYSISSPSGA